MDAKTYIRKQVNSMNSMIDDVLGNLSDENLTWLPPGTANLVGLTLLHLLSSIDYFISYIQGKKFLWETQSWGQKFNLEKAPDYGEDWSVYLKARLTVADVLAYCAAVHAQTRAYLDGLTDEALDRQIKFFSDQDVVADVLVLMVSHALEHVGEVAALKGVQGIKGLPY